MAVNDEPCETTFESITGMALSETGDAAAVVLVTSTAAADVNAFSQGLFSVAKSGVPGNEHFFNIWDINYDSSGKNLTWAIRLDRQTYGVAVIHWCLADSFFFGIYPTATFFLRHVLSASSAFVCRTHLPIRLPGAGAGSL
ncbi:hypothetical protein [Desulfobacter hydrogenophilus]|uniref:hypothetical protein n=1 Tax=Desulfobacter hydrogenophilus TaxID=2291 RepID=UPI0013D2BD05|nr:hypothetical protein [Desulfobacter hydrogenophilus]NDY72510.1 hypothetical protein [Desulfobacter hydrogenophilus]